MCSSPLGVGLASYHTCARAASDAPRHGARARGDVRRRGAGGAVACALAALLGACGSTDALGPTEQRAASTASFGDDNRLTATIEPGRVDDVVRTDRNTFVLALHASAPFGTVSIDNGNFSDQRVLTELGNVDAGALVIPRLRPLDRDVRRDARCDDPTYTDAAAIVLAPVVNEVVNSADGGRALLIDATLRPCVGLDLEVRLAPGRATWTMAIVNAEARSGARFVSAVAEAVDLDVDYIHVIGSTQRPDDDDPYEWARLELASTGIPWGVTLTTADRDDAAGFYDAFGVADLTFDVGNLRVVGLDTSARTLGDDRMRWLRQQAHDGEGLAITAVPPWDVDPLGRDSLSVGADAQRMHAALLEGGFTRLLSAAGDAPSRATISGIAYHDLGRAARIAPAEQLTVVVVDNPWSEVAACADAAACPDALRVQVGDRGR